MYAFLFVAGVGAGIAGYLVGLASLISYPAMVAMGIPPVVANTSNTVGLLGSGAGSVVGGWKRLRSLKTYPLSWQLTVSLFGGLAGGLLLVIVPSRVFEAVVPWLVALGTGLIAFGPLINRAQGTRRLPLGVYLTFLVPITIYGGYFGAGAGVLFLALCTLATPMGAHEAVLLKSPLLAFANLGAECVFVARDNIDWPAAVTVGLGAFVGGYAGPKVQRFFSERLLRWLVVVGGSAMVIWLFAR